MFFSDLISYEDKLDDIIDQIKILMGNGFLPKPMRKEIKKVLSQVVKNKRATDIDEIISVWEGLGILLQAFAISVISKVYNRGSVMMGKTKKLRKLTDGEKLELMRLEAYIYLAVAFNEMDLFLGDYAGETMLSEMMMVRGSNSMEQLQQLIVRLRGILEQGQKEMAQE